MIRRHGALDTLGSLVRGCDVALYGSAPGAAFIPGKLTVCVNGAALGLGKPPAEITFLNSSTLLDDMPARLGTRDRLRELDAGHVIVIDAAMIMPPIPYGTWKSASYMALPERNEILGSITGWPIDADAMGEVVPSTGYFAALCLSACGARSIEMSGFAFTGGHSYLVENTVRQHIVADRKALDHLLKGPCWIQGRPEFNKSTEEPRASA